MPINSSDLNYAIAKRLGVLDEAGQNIRDEFKPPRFQDPASMTFVASDGRQFGVINMLGAEAEQLVAPRQPTNPNERPGFGLSPEDARKALEMMGRDPDELKLSGESPKAAEPPRDQQPPTGAREPEGQSQNPPETPAASSTPPGGGEAPRVIDTKSKR